MIINLTLIIQTAFFFIAFSICYRCFWPKLIATLDERRETIEKGIKHAKQADLMLQEASFKYQKKLEYAEKNALLLMEETRIQAAQLVNNAKESAEEARKRLIEKADKEIASAVQTAKLSLEKSVAAQVLSSASKIIQSVKWNEQALAEPGILTQISQMMQSPSVSL